MLTDTALKTPTSTKEVGNAVNAPVSGIETVALAQGANGPSPQGKEHAETTSAEKDEHGKEQNPS